VYILKGGVVHGTGTSLTRDDAGARQAKQKAKMIERIGVLGQDGKKYKLSYDGPQQVFYTLNYVFKFRV